MQISFSVRLCLNGLKSGSNRKYDAVRDKARQK